MARVTRGYNPYQGRIIPREDIIIAIQAGVSMRGAAEYMGITYPTFRKYAKLYNLWDPKSSAVGIPRARKAHWTGWTRIGRPEHLRLLDSLIRDGKIVPHCNHCSFNKVRELDKWSPLIINFIDNNDTNYSSDNIEVLCYNCYFLDWDRKRKFKHVPLDYVSSIESDTRELDGDDILKENTTEETGDDLLKELEGSLINLFNKN